MKTLSPDHALPHSHLSHKPSSLCPSPPPASLQLAISAAFEEALLAMCNRCNCAPMDAGASSRDWFAKLLGAVVARGLRDTDGAAGSASSAAVRMDREALRAFAREKLKDPTLTAVRCQQQSAAAATAPQPPPACRLCQLCVSHASGGCKHWRRSSRPRSGVEVQRRSGVAPTDPLLRAQEWQLRIGEFKLNQALACWFEVCKDV